jgi:hypothetical protein
MKIRILVFLTWALSAFNSFAANDSSLTSSLLETLDPVRGIAPKGASVKITGSYVEYNGDIHNGGTLQTSIDFSSTMMLGHQPYLIFEAEPYNQYDANGAIALSRNLSIYHNGDNWYTLMKSKVRADGSVKELKQANIDKLKPNLIGDKFENFVVGEAAFLTDLMFYEGKTIMSLIDGDFPYIGVLESNDVGDRIKITLTNDCAFYSVEFEKESLSILEYTKTLGLCGGGDVIEIAYEYLFDALDTSIGSGLNLKYPSELRRYYKYNDKIEYSAQIKISEVSFSSAEGDDFVPAIPSGWWIHDKRNNIVFKSGDSKSDILNSLKILDE